MTFSIRHRSAFIVVVAAVIVFLVYFVFQLYIADVQVDFNSQTLNVDATPHGWNTESDLKIPLVVHHTWKRSTPPPGELVRWRQGCMKLNSEYTFVMYNDEDLLAFTRQHYQQYLPMFEHLYGVCKFGVVISVCILSLFHRPSCFLIVVLALLTYRYGRHGTCAASLPLRRHLHGFGLLLPPSFQMFTQACAEDAP